MQILPPSSEPSLDRRAPMFIDHETIRLTKNGVWLSDGVEIAHEQSVRAFKQNLQRDQQGYFIRLGNNEKRIEVEDTAYFVELAFRDPVDGTIRLRISDETEVACDSEKLNYLPGRLTVRVRDGKEEARFLPQPYHWTLMQLDEKVLRELEARAPGPH